MFRQLLPLGMLVMIAILAVVFFTGREGQFAAAASRLPDQVMHHAQSLRSDMEGKVVILKDIVGEEDGSAAPKPVLLDGAAAGQGETGGESVAGEAGTEDASGKGAPRADDASGAPATQPATATSGSDG